MEELTAAFESEEALLEYIKLEERKQADTTARKDNNDPYKHGKYNQFLDARSGKVIKDIDGNHFASRSPQFNRKAYPYLSEKEFVTKRPR